MLTVFDVAMTLECHPEVAHAFKKLGHEIACHGYRWIHYQEVPEQVEREHMQRAIEIFQRLYGEKPQGWYTGRDSPNTRRLVLDEGSFLYDSDNYGDDLPFRSEEHTSELQSRGHLVCRRLLEKKNNSDTGSS